MNLADQDIRLVPRPLWGISLAALCTASCWKRIAAEIGGAQTSCRFCKSPGYHRPGPLHGHERWNYRHDRATLEGVWWLCSTCHDVFHPGRVQAVQGDAGLSRVTAIYAQRCGITQTAARDRIAAAFDRFVDQSRCATWTIDLGPLPDSVLPLKLKRGRDERVITHRWCGDPFARSEGVAVPE